MPVICFICNQTLKNDALYLDHMQKVHGTTSPDKAMAEQKLKEENLPQQQIVSKDVPPSPEFMEIAQMMDNPSLPPMDAKPTSQASGKQLPLEERESKPLELRYQWIGECPQCHTPIRTIIIKPGDKCVVVAYCLSHNEVEQREVPLLEPTEKTAPVGQEGGVNDERTTIHMGEKQTKPRKMRSPRLQESSQANL